MISLDELQRFAPAGKPDLLRGLAASASDLEEAGITTPARICHFLSQTAHESDGFHVTTEYASGAAYEGRKDLGNVNAGDGKRFRGRGLIQCTGRANYWAFNTWARARWPNAPDFMMAPEKLALFPWALRSALWFWESRNLNRFADKGDIRGLTKMINGGFNGLPDRRNWFRKATEIWGDERVDPAGRPFLKSRTVKAALTGGGLGLAGLSDSVYQVSNAVEGGKSISDAIGISFVTMAMVVLIIGLLGYIIYDRWFIRKNEGL